IYGVPEKGEAAAAKLDQQVKAVTEKLPKDGKRIVIMHAIPSNVTVELENSIAGCVAKMLGFQNVAVGATPIKGKPEKTPYSMEALVEKNPEIIFITFMGDSEEIENRLRADVKSNPAWASLEAVRNNKVYLLPERLFLLNPGLHYPDAVKYMAKTVYPEVFKDDK
ncbi:ABC transporter substrate-binding protein, partial [Phascolarctobacterium faecium]|uniref:ABC transporter substrate-binding protein n=1 Tax=Phascolarctobacterium faecium TaxID=33025 RepID=UPI002673A286